VKDLEGVSLETRLLEGGGVEQATGGEVISTSDDTLLTDSCRAGRAAGPGR